MGFYEDLVNFLDGLDDFFIEVEGKPNQLNKFIVEYNSQTGARVTINTDGICVLGDVDKWGLEFRVYTNERPSPPLRNKFHKNTTVRHSEYEYRLSDNDLVKPLLFNGFHLGQN